MSKPTSEENAPPRGRGRPAVGERIEVRLYPQTRAALDAARKPGETLPETIRRILDGALQGNAEAKSDVEVSDVRKRVTNSQKLNHVVTTLVAALSTMLRQKSLPTSSNSGQTSRTRPEPGSAWGDTLCGRTCGPSGIAA